MSMYCTDIFHSDASKGTTLKILIEPENISCSIGDYANLSAVVKCHHPSYQWYNEFGSRIPMQTNGNLFLGPIKAEDFGFYRLEIVDITTDERVLTRWVELMNKDPIGTETKPIFVTSSAGGSYRIGSTFTLTAYFRNATYHQWYKDGKMLESCTENSLNVHNINMASSGEYVLAAINGTKDWKMELTAPIRVNVF